MCIQDYAKRLHEYHTTLTAPKAKTIKVDKGRSRPSRTALKKQAELAAASSLRFEVLKGTVKQRRQAVGTSSDTDDGMAVVDERIDNDVDGLAHPLELLVYTLMSWLTSLPGQVKERLLSNEGGQSDDKYIRGIGSVSTALQQSISSIRSIYNHLKKLFLRKEDTQRADFAQRCLAIFYSHDNSNCGASKEHVSQQCIELKDMWTQWACASRTMPNVCMNTIPP